MKILVVDDETAVVEFLKGAARTRGIEDVDTAKSGEEALGRVVQEEYDLITVDIKMPGVSGLEILSVLRSMCPHAIIAVISGHIPPELDEETAAAADVLLTKPIHLATFGRLMAATQQIMEAREIVQSLAEEHVAEVCA